MNVEKIMFYLIYDNSMTIHQLIPENIVNQSKIIILFVPLPIRNIFEY